MNILLKIGVTVVNLALISYSLFFIRLILKRESGKMLLTFLISGVILDLSSTICMILGSSNGPLTLHGLIGYAALLGMIVDLFLILRYIKYNKLGQRFSKAIMVASTFFYCYWMAAYITGALLVML